MMEDLFTKVSAETWYPAFRKTVFIPSSWIFVPVWIVLFVMMGISAYLLIWEKGLDEKRIRNASGVFLFPLIVSVILSIAFFGMRSIESGLLAMMILGTAVLWIIKFQDKFVSSLSLYSQKWLCPSFQRISPVHRKENPFLNLKNVFLFSSEKSRFRSEGEIGQECPYPKTWTFLTWKFGRK